MIWRKGLPEELAPCWCIYQDAVAHMLAQGIEHWDEEYPTREIVAGDLDAGKLLVVEQDGRLVAALRLDEEQHPTYQSLTWRYLGRVYVLHRLCLHPDAQGQGLAQQIMADVLIYGRQAGYDALRLDTFLGNPRALNLYDKMSFERVGVVQFRKRTFMCFEKALDKNTNSQ